MFSKNVSYLSAVEKPLEVENPVHVQGDRPFGARWVIAHSVISCNLIFPRFLVRQMGDRPFAIALPLHGIVSGFLLLYYRIDPDPIGSGP